MLKLIGVLRPDTCTAIREHLSQLDSHLEADISSYARGRKRYWLEWEWDLKHKVFRPGVRDERLWTFCQRIFPGCQIGLVAKGSVGIGWHRDDSYADWEAVTINLGQSQWGYDYQYPGYSWSQNRNPSNPVIYDLPDGGVIKFNPKNPHAAINPASNRYSINLWRISKKYQDLLPG